MNFKKNWKHIILFVIYSVMFTSVFVFLVPKISSKIKKLLKFKKIMTKEDYLLWLILSKKYKIIGINKYLTNWRSVKDSLSSSLIQKFNYLTVLIFLLKLLAIILS